MVTRPEFVKAVKDFKKNWDGKLKNLLNERNNPEAVAAFWANPIIRTYLARPSISFDAKHPQLQDSTMKEEHETSDHYELKVYKYLHHEVIYRDNKINSDEFYTRGLFRSHNSSKDHAPQVFEALIKTLAQGEKDIAVTKPQKIFDIAKEITRLPFVMDKTIYPRFILSPCWDHTHAFICVTIVNPLTGSSLLTLFMNSGLSNKSYVAMEERFRVGITYVGEKEISEKQRENIQKFLIDSFPDLSSMHLDDDLPPTFLTNESKKAVVAINCGMSDYPLDFDEQVMSHGIERIYRINDKIFHHSIGVEIYPKMPFIDVSHDLQRDRNEKNCTLYGVNFIHGIIEMLKQPEMADRIYRLACNVAENNIDDTDTFSMLKQIFREDLKSYLPCYYDTDTRLCKSQEEMDQFHLKQMWRIGSESISILHPLNSEMKGPGKISLFEEKVVDIEKKESVSENKKNGLLSSQTQETSLQSTSKNNNSFWPLPSKTTVVTACLSAAVVATAAVVSYMRKK